MSILDLSPLRRTRKTYFKKEVLSKPKRYRDIISKYDYLIEM